jgi:hypothetical protein
VEVGVDERRVKLFEELAGDGGGDGGNGGDGPDGIARSSLIPFVWNGAYLQPQTYTVYLHAFKGS